MPRLTRKTMAESADSSSPARRSSRATTQASSISTRTSSESPATAKRVRSSTRGRSEKSDPEEDVMQGSEEEEVEEAPAKRGSARGRKSAGSTPARKGRSTSRSVKGKEQEEEEEDEEEEDVTPKGRRGARGRASTTPASAEIKSGGRGRSRRGKHEEEEEEEKEPKHEEAVEESNEDTETPTARGRRGSRGKAEETPSSAGRGGRRGKKQEEKAEPAESKVTPKGRRGRRATAEEHEEEDKEVAKTEENEESKESGNEAAKAEPEPMEAEVDKSVAVEDLKVESKPPVGESTSQVATEEPMEVAPPEAAVVSVAETVATPTVPTEAAETIEIPTVSAEVCIVPSADLASVPAVQPEVSSSGNKRRLEEQPEEVTEEVTSKRPKNVTEESLPSQKEVVTPPASSPTASSQAASAKLDAKPAFQPETAVPKESPRPELPGIVVSEPVEFIPVPELPTAPVNEDTPVQKSSEEDITKDFVVVSKEEVPAHDSSEVLAVLPKAVESSLPTELVSPAAPVSVPPIDPDPSLLSSVEKPSQVEVAPSAPSNGTESVEPMEVDEASTKDKISEKSVTPEQPDSNNIPPVVSNLSPQGQTIHSHATKKHPPVPPQTNNIPNSVRSIDIKEPVVIKDIPVPPVIIPQSTGDPLFTRRFVPNRPLSSAVLPEKTFSLVSYNILASCHIIGEKYAYTSPECLSQEYRHRRLMEELRYLDADVVCLQEVNPEYYQSTLQPEMASLGYSGAIMKRTQDYFDEGEATFYRTSRFDLVEAKGLSLSELAYKELDISGPQGDIKSAAKKYLDRADVVLITRLRCRNSGNIVTMGNIHVVYDHLSCPDVQCVQIACAIREIVNKAGSDSSPHILCGDFNSEPSSPGYQLACDGYLPDSSIRKLQSLEGLVLPDDTKKALVNQFWKAFQHTSTNLKSAYALTTGAEPEATTLTSSMNMAVDYILFNATSLDCLGVLDTVSRATIEATKGLPNQLFPSDHISLKAAFAFKY